MNKLIKNQFERKQKGTVSVLCIVCVLLAGWFYSCGERGDATDDLSRKISPDSESQVIEKEINGIVFKFCLLNEQGKPATVFNEGKNFSFYFSVTNKTDEKLYYFPEFAYTNTRDNEFCEVFTSDSQKIGRPFIFLGYDKIGIGAYPFNPKENYIFEQPWVDLRDSVWCWKYGHYESNNQISLPTGSYFTEFQSHFQIRRTDTSSLFLDTVLTFKINFQIK